MLARKSFYCIYSLLQWDYGEANGIGELCSKGYSRMNEFEAHENSYDHQHKKVLLPIVLLDALGGADCE